MINSYQSRNSQEHPRAAIFSQAMKRCLPDMFVRFGEASRAAWVTLVLLALSMLISDISTAHAQGTAFTYQGQLQNNGSPANGNYDLQFSLFDALTSGNKVGITVTNLVVGVTNGLFTTTLDFGSGVFNSTANWLDISVRTNGTLVFTELSRRQQLTPSPYAIYSENSGAASSVVANSISAASLSTAGSPASGQVLSYNGTGLMWTDPSSGGSSGWSLTGNSGANPTNGNFLGTTDNEPLEFHVNGARALRLELAPGGYPNVIGGSSQNAVAPGFSGAAIGGGYGNSVNNYWVANRRRFGQHCRQLWRRGGRRVSEHGHRLYRHDRRRQQQHGQRQFLHGGRRLPEHSQR